MSCQTNANKVSAAAGGGGLSKLSSSTAYAAAQTLSQWAGQLSQSETLQRAWPVRLARRH